MTYIPFLAAEGIVESLSESAKRTGETFGFNSWLLFSQMISFVIVALILHHFAYKPILKVLDERRKKIADGLANAEKIKHQLAESEKRVQEILTKANAQAQQMIDEARSSAQVLSDKKAQQAIAEAEQIIARAREATIIERDKTFADLKREVGRLVINTTAKVTGKVLSNDDQKRLSDEATREVAA
jgi:F-type H+-transporting ATPase subunit b